MSQVTLNIYSIERPVWSQVTEHHKEAIKDYLTRGLWTYDEDKRKGFLNSELIGGLVYGYYAQEGDLLVEQYDDKQQPKQAEQRSFEKILFLLLLDQGILVAQTIRISRFVDLSGVTVRQSLFDGLETAFRIAGLVSNRRAKFEPFRHEFTNEQLYEIFESNSIQRVVVGGLQYKTIPDDFRFFNPDFNADYFLKTVIDADLELSKEVDWSGTELQQTKITTGLVRAGDPQLIEGYDNNRVLRQWRPSTPEKILMELDTSAPSLPEEDLRRLLDRIQLVFGGFTERFDSLRRLRNVRDLPIFGGQEDG